MGEFGENKRNDEKAPPSRQDRRTERSMPKAAPAVVHRTEITEDEIDAAIADSFPASDPPFWNSGIDR